MFFFLPFHGDVLIPKSHLRLSTFQKKGASKDHFPQILGSSCHLFLSTEHGKPEEDEEQGGLTEHAKRLPTKEVLHLSCHSGNFWKGYLTSVQQNLSDIVEKHTHTNIQTETTHQVTERHG